MTTLVLDAGKPARYLDSMRRTYTHYEKVQSEADHQRATVTALRILFRALPDAEVLVLTTRTESSGGPAHWYYLLIHVEYVSLEGYTRGVLSEDSE